MKPGPGLGRKLPPTTSAPGTGGSKGRPSACWYWGAAGAEAAGAEAAGAAFGAGAAACEAACGGVTGARGTSTGSAAGSAGQKTHA